jgi:hypothetical protein
LRRRPELCYFGTRSAAAIQFYWWEVYREIWRAEPVSISLFFANPIDQSEKLFSVPVLTEAAFEQAVLPAAQLVGAEMVCRLGVGLEVAASDVNQLESELQRVERRIAAPMEVKQYVQGRFHGLITELRQVFARRPDALLYIG